MLKWFKAKEPALVKVVLKFEGDAEGPHPERGLQGGEPYDEVYAEFERDFYHRPGENLVQTIRQANAPALLAWLEPSANSAEAMAFVTLAVNATRSGLPFWEQTALKGFRDGSPPDRRALDGLTALAMACGKRIRLYYEKPGRPGEFLLRDFEP